MREARKPWMNLVFLAALIAAAEGYALIYTALDLYPVVTPAATQYIQSFPAAGYAAALALNVLMGMLFGLEGLLRFRRTPGKWRADGFRLLLLGLPLLLLSMDPVVFQLPLFRGMTGTLLLTAPAREPFYRFFLGYVLLSSLYKQGAALEKPQRP